MSHEAHIERLAKSFRLNGPSESLKQQVLTSARSVWAAPDGTKGHADSLKPYFAALAATVLMLISVNATGNYAAQSRQSNDYVVTVRPCQTSQFNEELSANLPYGRSMALCIVGVSRAQGKNYFHQLQTLLSQGASL
ncbi:MAG: hypothetical protein K9N55_03175 [Phycisphaerae bacterium]|nr:hypothetical protein [Phycisphaerae bacterium]